MFIMQPVFFFFSFSSLLSALAVSSSLKKNNGLFKEVDRQNAILHDIVSFLKHVYMLISNSSLHGLQVMNASFERIGQDECV